MSLLRHLRRSALRFGLSVGKYPHTGNVEAHLVDVFSHFGIDCVFDVGANGGEYGRRIREDVGYHGRIISFEPGSAAFGRLRDCAAGDASWTVLNIALGAERGVGRLSVESQDNLNSLHASTSYGKQVFGLDSDPQHEEVVVRRLDSLIQCLKPGYANFLKIDTQGHDLEVLKGAAFVPNLVAIQLEVALQSLYEGVPSLKEVLEHLQAMGFAISGVFPVSRDSLLQLVEIDVVAVKIP